jgi:hypothetical protein
MSINDDAKHAPHTHLHTGGWFFQIAKKIVKSFVKLLKEYPEMLLATSTVCYLT